MWMSIELSVSSDWFQRSFKVSKHDSKTWKGGESQERKIWDSLKLSSERKQCDWVKFEQEKLKKGGVDCWEKA